MDDVTLAWAAGACVVVAASLVQGLAGFGIGLVALAFLPFLMSPGTAVVLMTVYALVFSAAMFVPLRRHFVAAGMTTLLICVRGGPRHGPPHPPTLGAPRGTRGAPRSRARSSAP